MAYTYKHNAAIEMEQGIELVFHTNDMDERSLTVKSYGRLKEYEFKL